MSASAAVRAQQIGQRAVAEPFAMQPPLAARRDQPIGHQHEQHLIPARALAAGRQAIGPEPIELQLLPQLQGQPAGAPLPRPQEPQLRELQAHDRARPASTPRIDPRETARAFARPASSSNTSIDLRHATSCEELISPRYSTCRCTTRPPLKPLVLDDAQVAVLFAVLLASRGAQKHLGAPPLTTSAPRSQGAKSSPFYPGFAGPPSHKTNQLPRATPRNLS